MKHGIVAVFSVVLIMLSAAAIFVQSDDSDAATDTFDVVGYVKEINNGAIAVSGKTVTISDPSDNASWTGITDSAGRFSISVPKDESHLGDLRISIDYPGYSFVNGPCITPDGTECKLDLSGYDGTTSTFEVGKSTDSIIVSTSNVSISITVTGSERALIGVNISLYSDSGVIYSGITDNDGVYKVNSGDDIETGLYRCVMKCDGYKLKEESFEVSLGKTNYTFQMEEKTIATYGGLTTYQILMIAGVVIGVTLVIISYALCRRNWAGMDDSEE